ncbi:MAG: Sec-independent protein translocase subunit TatA/TatB [Spirochaetota bacterium]
MGGIGGLEILLILVVGIVIFGVIKLPHIARILGTGLQGYRKFKNGFKIDSIIDNLSQSQPNQHQTPNQQQPPGNPNSYNTPPYQQNRQPPTGHGQGPQSQSQYREDSANGARDREKDQN